MRSNNSEEANLSDHPTIKVTLHQQIFQIRFVSNLDTYIGCPGQHNVKPMSRAFKP